MTNLNDVAALREIARDATRRANALEHTARLVASTADVGKCYLFERHGEKEYRKIVGINDVEHIVATLHEHGPNRWTFELTSGVHGWAGQQRPSWISMREIDAAEFKAAADHYCARVLLYV